MSIFLFFLSVALLYQNRQDVALSLSMEHKLKAQSEARSLAMEVYGQLRELGRVEIPSERESETGVKSRFQLLSLPPQEDRGKVIAVRVRSTSGPVSAYYTLRLLETEMVSPESGDPVLFFPGGGGQIGIVYGDFTLRTDELDVSGQTIARDGPLMNAKEAATDPPAFVGYVPVFPETGSTLKAFGPVLTVGPSSPGQGTTLRWLKASGEDLSWENIPFPGYLQEEGPNYEMELTVVPVNGSGDWSNISLNGIGDQFRSYSWFDPEPSTARVDEAQSLTPGETNLASPLVDWSAAGSQSNQEFFATRGAIAAQGNTLYSHGWHYLFRPYSGRLADPVTALDGPQITRWPCVLKYDVTGETWSKAWSPLDSTGDVKSSIRPDPNVLLVNSGGQLYSTTIGQPRKLIQLMSSGGVVVGEEVPVGDLFLYQDRPHRVNSSGLIEDVESSTVLGFSSLPDRLPEVYGPLLEIPQGDSMGIDEVGVIDLSPEGAMEFTGTRLTTVSPEVLFAYRVTDGAKPALIGKDLLISVDVEVTLGGTGYPLWNSEFVAEQMPKSATALARYDGTRWHVLPNGLRGLVEQHRHQGGGSEEGGTADYNSADSDALGSDTSAPTGASRVLVGNYPNLTQQLNRYAIISIDTNQFEFNQ